MSNDCKRIAERFVNEAWNQGQVELLDELFADSDEIDDPSATYERDAVATMIDDYRTRFPSFHLEVEDCLADGNTVVANIEGEGTITEKRFGMFSVERGVVHKFVLVFRFTKCPDGRLLSVDSIPDPRHLYDPNAALPWFEKGLALLARQPVFRHAILIFALISTLVLLNVTIGRYGFRLAGDWGKTDREYWSLLPGLSEIFDRQFSATDAKGRYVTFVSNNDEIATTDSNQNLDVFVHDRTTHETRHVSMSDPVLVDGKCTGTSADGWSIHPTISTDGRFVTFRSSARLVDPAKRDDDLGTVTRSIPNTTGTMYIHDMKTCTTLPLKDYVTLAVDEAAGNDSGIQAFEEPDAAMPELWWMGASFYQRTRLLNQHQRVRELALRHLTIAIYFFVQTFAAITVATISALCAAVALLFITRSGWSDANSYVVTVFITLTATTIFFTAMPNLFSYAQNIETNKAKYISYAALEHQIWSYITTGHLTSANQSEDDRLTPEEFILHVDDKLVAFASLPLELNPGAIPDIGSVLQEMSDTERFIEPPAVEPTPSAEPTE